MGKSPFVLLLLYSFTYLDLNLCQPTTSAQNSDPGNADVANDAQMENADNDAPVPSSDTQNAEEPLHRGDKNATDGPEAPLKPMDAKDLEEFLGTFPFLKNAPQNSVDEWRAIIHNPKLTKAELEAKRLTWAKEQTNPLRSAYNEWHRNKEKRKQEEMADHEKTIEMITHGAKALYERIKTIIANMSITRRQECELVRHVILAAPRDARDEFARSISMKLVTFCFRSSPPNSIGAKFLEMNKEAFRHPPSHFDQYGQPNDSLSSSSSEESIRPKSRSSSSSSSNGSYDDDGSSSSSEERGGHKGRPYGRGYGNVRPQKNPHPKSKWHPPTYMHPDAMHPYMDSSYVHPAYMHPAYVHPAYMHPAMQTPYVHPSAYAYGVPPPAHNPYDHHFIKYLKGKLAKQNQKDKNKNGNGNENADKNVQTGSSSSSNSSSEAKDVTKGQGKGSKKGSKPKGVKDAKNDNESSSESSLEPQADPNANSTQPKKEKTPTAAQATDQNKAKENSSSDSSSSGNSNSNEEDVNKPSHKPLKAAPKSIKFKDPKTAPLPPQKRFAAEEHFALSHAPICLTGYLTDGQGRHDCYTARGNAHKAVSAEEAQQTPMTPHDTQDSVQPPDQKSPDSPSPRQTDVNDSPVLSQDPIQNTENAETNTENAETNTENAVNAENIENNETGKDKKGKEDNADAELSKTDDKEESSSEDVDDESEESSEDSDEKKGEKNEGKGKADAEKPAGGNGAKKQK